jgi:hypothetical protein
MVSCKALNIVIHSYSPEGHLRRGRRPACRRVLLVHNVVHAVPSSVRFDFILTLCQAQPMLIIYLLTRNGSPEAAVEPVGMSRGVADVYMDLHCLSYTDYLSLLNPSADRRLSILDTFFTPDHLASHSSSPHDIFVTYKVREKAWCLVDCGKCSLRSVRCRSDSGTVVACLLSHDLRQKSNRAVRCRYIADFF